MEVESGSVVIALSTYPKENTIDEFITQVEQNISNYKKGRAKNFLDIDYSQNEEIEFNHKPSNTGGDAHIPSFQKKGNFHLYHNPIKYHIFGKYDIAFVSLAENFSLSNKVFLPTRIDSDYKPGYIKSHVLSGIPLKCHGKSSEEKFNQLLGYDSVSLLTKSSFICISNLKLNNSFLIGNGLDFIRLVKIKIEAIIGSDIMSMVVMSFASAEISLLLFSENIEESKEKILQIRGMKINELPDIDSITLESILTKSIIPDEVKIENEKYLNSHVFSDSQSFFGVRLDEKNDWVIKDHPNFKTKIEWEIRPGHEMFVHKILSDQRNNVNFENNSIEFIPGKTDFCFNFEDDTKNLSLNYEVYKLLRRPDKDIIYDVGNLIDHVRSIKTKIFFDVLPESSNEIDINPGKKSSQSTIRKAMVSKLSDIHDLRLMLKKLKISRELRNRIIKVVFNFDSAIQNPLVYNLFLDLSFFVLHLKQLIELWSDEVDNYFDINDNRKAESVHSIEKKLSTLIEIFEDAYNLRYINNYSFDEVSDFLIDYNSPLQQIITSFDNYFKSLYSLLVDSKTANSNITRVNELQTQATQLSVNFSIYNLYEPGILFYCATKEIYTAYFKIEKHKQTDYGTIISKYQDYCKSYFLNNPNSPCSHHQNLIYYHDANYHIIDYSRFIIFFDSDFKLFLFWHLAFLFQFPAIYDTNGDFNKEQFLKEFNRLLFLAIMTDFHELPNEEREKLKEAPGINENFLKNYCPNPKIKNIWRRTYNETRDFIVDLIIDKNEYFEGNSFGQLTINIHGGSLSRKLNFHENSDDSDIYYEKMFLQAEPENDHDFSFIFDSSNGIINSQKLNNIFSFTGESKKAIQSITKQYLKEIYNRSRNNGSFIIPSLNRDWHTGDIEMVTFYNKESNFLFDPNGGAFFHSFEKAKDFSLIRNKLYMILIHHSNLYKKTILKNWLKISNNEN